VLLRAMRHAPPPGRRDGGEGRAAWARSESLETGVEVHLSASGEQARVVQVVEDDLVDGATRFQAILSMVVFTVKML
jgi:hypothetical protein